jgi:hypothetical protein
MKGTAVAAAVSESGSYGKPRKQSWEFEIPPSSETPGNVGTGDATLERFHECKMNLRIWHFRPGRVTDLRHEGSAQILRIARQCCSSARLGLSGLLAAARAGHQQKAKKNCPYFAAEHR